MISFLSVKEYYCVEDCKDYIYYHTTTCDLIHSNRKSPLQRFYDPVTKDYYIAIRTLKNKIIKIKNPLISNKYLMYSVIYDDKLRAIAIYIDKKGNIKSRIISFKEFYSIIFSNNMYGSDEISELLKEIDEVENSYELKFLDLVEGYNHEDIPHSCQKGKGHLLSQYKDKASLGALLHKYSKKIVARAIIWNDGIVKNKKGNPIGRAADLIYVYEGKYKEPMREALKKENIKYLYSGRLDYRSFNIEWTPDEGDTLEENALAERSAGMDTFNHLNYKENRLYSYNFKRDKTNTIHYDDDISFIFLKTDGNCIINNS